MKAMSVRYERLANTGPWAHVKVGIEYAVEVGDTPESVLEAAQSFVRHAIGKEKAIAEAKALKKEKEKQRIIAELAKQAKAPTEVSQ